MKNIFSQNPDVDKTAYLNWRTNRHDHINNMIVIGGGFMSSALLLAKNILEDNHDKKADNLIFPILFNINHGIEVYLKAIAWQLNILENNKESFIPNHQLKELLENVKALVYSFESGTEKIDRFDEMIEPLDNYISELYSKIEKVKPNGNVIYSIDFSRYTLDNKMEPQFYINELDNVMVDLEYFLEVFTDIRSSLDSIAKHYLYDFEEG